jgi:hypothetical protein
LAHVGIVVARRRAGKLRGFGLALRLLCAYRGLTVKSLRTLFMLALFTTACDGDDSEAGTSSDAGAKPVMVGAPYNECSVDSDCAWGEIKREILKKSDCMCLYGCPHIPLAQSTVSRRAAQHEALCDPRSDGNGDSCGIDDCATPPPIACQDGVCAAAGDAGSS